MTVAELMRILDELDPEATVGAWDFGYGDVNPKVTVSVIGELVVIEPVWEEDEEDPDELPLVAGTQDELAAFLLAQGVVITS